MKEKTFLKGALILAAANFAVKIIGACFKIPLYELLGKEGNGLFNVAYQIYTFMFIIATAGFPIAVSKMVAESTAKGDEYDARRIFETALLLLGIIGLIGSTVLYVFSEQLAAFLGNEAAAMGIRAIAPSVFFVSMVSAYRGYFQGKQNMYPTAASEVIEATAKLGIGIIAALFFMRMAINPNLSENISFSAREAVSRDVRVRYASGGAIMGVTVGTLLSLILMMIVYRFGEKKASKGLSGVRSRSRILKELVVIAIPITIGASVSSLTSLVDLATIMNRLVVNPDVFDKYAALFGKGTEFYKIAAEEGWQGSVLYEKMANSLYGMYTGQAQTMFNLPLTIVVGLSMSVVPAISTLVAENKREKSLRMTESAIRITMIFAAPCAVGLSVLAKPVLGILYTDTSAYMLLEKLAIAVIFVAVVSVTNAILQAYGRVYYPVVNMLVGGTVKVLMNYMFIPVWGIDAAPLATNVCYAVIAALNIICIIKIIKAKISVLDMILKPLAASVIMGAAAVGAYRLLFSALGESRIIGILAIMAGAAVYLAVIVLIKGFKRDDILNMPGGGKIAAVMEKYKLL